MKRIAPLVAVALALAAMALIRVERGTPRRRPPERSERETGGPEDWMLSQRVIPNGIPAGALERAAVQARKVRATTSRTDPSLAQASWKPLGPSNIGGRIVDAVVDPAHADTLYVAAATGGVWKSTDKGSTFSPVWPAANVQAMGALAITPDGGTLYAGTGEANPGGGSITYGGQGVYRSTNGGANWQNVGLAGTGAIGRIAIDPKNPQRIMVAAAGRLYDPGGRRGVYRSTNGGATWSRVLAGANDTTGAVDVAIDPNDPQRVYAAMWDHVRHPDLRVYGGVGSGVFRSVDGGATWHRLSNGLPGPSPAIGRIGIALSPSNPMRLYAIVIRTLGPFEGFYTSADGGDSWTKLADDGTLSGAQSSYGWWFGRVWVDPVDARHVFVAGVYLCESNNGGTSFLGQVAGHADDHAMAWDPNVARRVYLGNDGGVWRSEVNGSNDEWSFGTDEPFTQFYSVDVSEQNARRVVGGAQDNNALRTWGGPRWNAYVGGDGEETLINPTNQQNVFGCSQYGVCSRSVDGGDTMIFMGSAASDRWNWFSPLQFAPSDPSVLYLGGNKLNRSTNGGVTFKLISPDLTGGPGPDPNYPFGTITTVASARTNPSEMLAGTDDGRLWYSTDSGAHWTRVMDPDVPGTWVTRVAVDPTDANVAYATFSGFRGGDPIPYVLRTADGGSSWSSITSNLPQAPVNDIAISGSALYVATDVGVYRSKNIGATWQAVGTGLPNVPVTDLELRAASNTLYAASFGRGMWSLSLG
jgi:hypothetical protein